MKFVYSVHSHGGSNQKKIHNKTVRLKTDARTMILRKNIRKKK